MHSFRSLSRFLPAEKGNFGVMFALAMIPVIGGMGAAIDYSMANAYRTDMQKALDSTALALTRLMPTDQASLDTKGMQYFSASMGHHKLTGLNLTITPETGIIKLAAKGYYEPSVVGVLGITNFEVGARSEAKWGIGKVEVALALDNTGSMASSGKLTQLKTAAHNLLDVLEAAAKKPGDAKVAIVPFGVQVKVPTANVNAAWLRWDLWEETNGSCSSTSYSTKTSCQNAGRTWTAANHSNWNGRIEDREKDNSLNYDVNDTVPNLTTSQTTANVRTRFPTAQECGSLAEVMGLNYSWGTSTSTDSNTLHGKINQMQAVGNTNVTIGLTWAWHLLSPTVPFTTAAAYGTANLTKVIILLTDGDNTQNRWTTNESTINTRTSQTCDNIKAAGITIYTVRVIDGNASLLSGCASDSTKYFNVQDASQLTPVFNAIGGQIANLHLAK